MAFRSFSTSSALHSSSSGSLRLWSKTIARSSQSYWCYQQHLRLHSTVPSLKPGRGQTLHLSTLVHPHSPDRLHPDRHLNEPLSDIVNVHCRPKVSLTSISRRQYAQKTNPPGNDKEPPQTVKPTAKITRSIETARQRTKAVTQQLRSSLPSLTPRENIYNLPNFLTVSRLFAAPAISYLLLHDQHPYALALFFYAGITDLIDGYLARKWHLQTVAGSVIDPMADKALMIILTVTLAIKGSIPLYLATLILGRDASLALAAIYYRYASLPHPKTLLRYWDFSLPSAQVHPTTVSKYNTFLQLLLIGGAVALPVVTSSSTNSAAAVLAVLLQNINLHAAMTYFQYVVAATTAWSGLSYAFLKDAVTILGTDEELKSKQGARGRAIIGVVFGGVVAGAAWVAIMVDEEHKDDSQKKQGSIDQV